ncbi:MAG: hypothetical protein ACOYNO_07100 [Saprospiraceae bacterium]
MKKTVQLLAGLGMLFAVISHLNCTKKDENTNTCKCRDFEYCEDGVCKLIPNAIYIGKSGLFVDELYWGVADCFGCKDTIALAFTQNAMLQQKFEVYSRDINDYPTPGGAYTVQEYAEDDYLVWAPFMSACMGNEWLFRCKLYRQDSVQLQIVKLNFGQPVYPQDTCFVTLVH